MNTKLCYKCKKNLKINKFYKDNTKKDRLSSYCKKCHLQNMKNYYPIHKKEIIKRAIEYYYTHREKIKLYKKQCYQTNTDKIKLYNSTAKGIFQRIKIRAKLRKKIFILNEKEFISWYNNQEQKCYYCNRTLEKIKNDTKEKHKSILSIDRKDNNEGYKLDNIVLACRRCNYIKSDYFTEREMLRIGKLLYDKQVEENYHNQIK
jgi:5-methylcytosine-specific restriction endonuclease McrA